MPYANPDKRRRCSSESAKRRRPLHLTPEQWSERARKSRYGITGDEYQVCGWAGYRSFIGNSDDKSHDRN